MLALVAASSFLTMFMRGIHHSSPHKVKHVCRTLYWKYMG
ncbi:hypothetical protein PRUPE_1G047200 [Prunus persica]|uniref:Uncharacterized protein n=2 Tax=Prunus persica TaxID=3760 RepID=A0A251QSS8_PRUPE|nr:hypothetical protein PRUPE_1G047200 [Prunus persica]